MNKMVTLFFITLPLKDRKILGADRGSFEGGSPPDDTATRASTQDSLSHNIIPLLTEKFCSCETDNGKSI